MNTYGKSKYIYETKVSYNLYSSNFENRHRISRIKREQELRQHYFLMFITGMVILCSIFFAFGTVNISAHNNSIPEYKYYKSIVIQCDDTLYSIAEDNISTEHYHSLDEYIYEVKQINNIMTDNCTISAGSNLIIPYYSTEYRQ